ncbi:hypothetical protein BJ912DRAFT_1059672 [Pholiota molesta]|nr:hypothetical protein BJ912DRAFT_1059672 [Pholiota molesta]
MRWSPPHTELHSFALPSPPAFRDTAQQNRSTPPLTNVQKMKAESRHPLKQLARMKDRASRVVVPEQGSDIGLHVFSVAVVELRALDEPLTDRTSMHDCPRSSPPRAVPALCRLRSRCSVLLSACQCCDLRCLRGGAAPSTPRSTPSRVRGGYGRSVFWRSVGGGPPLGSAPSSA